ncbi:unnamed protein product [Adineta steineri]|uniref:Mothers against decapentaplegic homolog n=1 Tax=Adineta steineri TaxID=433720 RepID=A0A818UJ51_9BILA|nr:unnamed protein product [Adineta steineri]CAF3698762.1 unnamed protein product [Adineta steineri]
MWCDPPSIPATDVTQSNSLMPHSTANTDKKQLSFVYQPGIGLYDKKKIELDQDLRITSSTADVDERIQSLEISPTFSSDVDHRLSSSSSLESPSPNSKTNNLYKSYLRRQNEQDSLPIRQKLFASDDSSIDKNLKISDVNETTNQENNQKRKSDQNSISNKKLCQSPTLITKQQSQTEIISKSISTNLGENTRCEKNLLDEELNRQKAKFIVNDEQKNKQKSLPIKQRSNSNERLQKQSLTTIIKNIPMVKKLSTENHKPQINLTDKETLSIPSQGLLLCPKDEPIKKKKKKKIAPIITSNTQLLDDDSVLDSILFNEMQSVQQQWQQFLTLTMEKELHINPSDGKRKLKINKFQRTNEFLLAYENLYDFEGMKHWYPTSRFKETMSIASPTTTTTTTMMNNNSSPSGNPLTSLLHSITKKRSLSPIVQRFVDLCVRPNDMTPPSSNVNEHTEKIIRNLVKKLTKLKKNGSIEELEKAILHKDSRTKCVTIPRSLDTPPNQSSKSNPVVIYCRLWRWPDLSNQNELKPVDYCPNSFHYSRDDICINPFHYERVAAKYSVYVPHLPPEAFLDMPDLRSASMSNDIMPNQIPENTTYQATIEQQQSPPSYPLSPGSISSQDSLLSPPGATTNDDNNHNSHGTPMDFDSAPQASTETNSMYPSQQPVSTISSHPSQYSVTNGEQVPFEEPHEWCLISYYEMSTRVGEQFHATQPQIIIDGFTDPSNADRFCLGGLTNVHRTFDIDKARRHIGRGVKLFHIRGNVFAECISDNPVFVQSPITNQRLSWHPATVCKIPPKVRLKIFDSDDFTQILSAAVHESYEAVYNLMRMCIIRMSFVKGWGVEYRRQAVTCTPCWVEIHLEGPLKWLDTVLSTMRGPTQSITSVS